MKIHITGGDGYIGRNIFNSLRNKHEISTTDIQSLDVLNKDLLVKYLKEDTPGILIHLAGLMGAQQSKSELYKTFSVNSFGLLNVIEATYLAGVKNLIFFSSLTVHGAHHDRNKIVNEEDNFLPAHPYATSKVIAEYLLRDYSRLLNIKRAVLKVGPAIKILVPGSNKHCKKQKILAIKVLPQPRPHTHIEKFLFIIAFRVTS